MKKIIFPLVLSVLLAASSSAWAAATSVTPGSTTWTTGEYVVDSDVTVAGRISVTGDVVLILNDGCTLSADEGINVSEGNSLTIRTPAGSHGTGKLVATAYYDPGYNTNAAIGGGDSEDGGKITIEGGDITATGDGGAGIGSGEGNAPHSGATITITGGRVHARGGIAGAGIGGGSYGDGGTITITGGIVNASAERFGAGIGGGNLAGGGKITITGGVVNATGSEGGAGIGGGRLGRGSGCDITITGGIVTAICGSDSLPGIGGGEDASDHGTLKSTADGGAWISASSIKAKRDGFVSGVIFIGDVGTVIGSPTIDLDASISIDRTLTIPEGSTLTLEGIITADGDLVVDGKLVNDGEVIFADKARADALIALYGAKLFGRGMITAAGISYYNDGSLAPSPLVPIASKETIDEYVIRGTGLEVKNRTLTKGSALGAIASSGIELRGSATKDTITPLEIVSVDVAADSISTVVYIDIPGRELVSSDVAVDVRKLNIVKVISADMAVLLEHGGGTDGTPAQLDGTYIIMQGDESVREVDAASGAYTLIVRIIDDGKFDLAKGVKGVVDPLVLVKSTGESPQDDPTPGGGGGSGACGVGSGAAAIVGLAALALRKRVRRDF